MQGTRLERDAELAEYQNAVTELKTQSNVHGISCSLCNRTYYTDNSTFEGISRAIEEGLDNPFICDRCSAEDAEFAAAK